MSNELYNAVLTALEDLKARDITVLDVARLTSVTDTMVIACGTSRQHVTSIAHAVLKNAKELRTTNTGVEGMESGEWVLVDLGDVVVHVMHPDTRAFYQLEKLWQIPEDMADSAVMEHEALS